ncbi:hypothetical protein PF002_g19210 [Phytophthora fragariae]|uniref:Secreted protein n=1 Tax=Phytophthora fragariae TaxID=53985 RepID=A0A6A3PLK6_9STRA|nr:hypothetical protein PF003_g38550 [Phytophthora fragariae]KAE9055201.1 hypothetical protein PF007_g32393 [Phytophthora fragariae]KAE9156620.1 hypothetical protein PF002_g33568 [Phytophthora fragariae]KAE9209095.1 hypothetical protein PF002_g19210 [Phytophthora fragariae]KAE9259567.1 hypothetical protein PF008_g33328 [Phytophthora fragariae]
MQARKSFVTWFHLCCLLCACMQGSCFRPRTSSVYFGNLGMPLLSSSSGGKEGLEAPRPSSACELAYLSGDTATH